MSYFLSHDDRRCLDATRSDTTQWRIRIEFYSYLSSVFHFLYELSGEARVLTGIGPEELALRTAQNAFESHSKSLSNIETWISEI